MGFPDELSVGPISSDDVQIRAEWWDCIVDWPDYNAISAFWHDVAEGPPLVVWFSRCDARDLCLYMALCDRFPDRIAAIGDVSTVLVRYEWTDGTSVDVPSPQNVHGVPSDVLSALTALTVHPDQTEVSSNAQRWRNLKAENAPFRVVSEGTLVSKPITYFDDVIMGAATTEWRKTIGVIYDALKDCTHQLNEYVMLSRVVALVESGALQAEGDPRLMHGSRIRLAPRC
jgi:hypothetical protein